MIGENLPRILHFPIKELLDSSLSDNNLDEKSKTEIKELLGKAIEVDNFSFNYVGKDN